MTPPMLHCPDPTLPYEVHCDASGVAVAGVLAQKTKRKEFRISYSSRSLFRAERKYTTTGKECLAILHSLENFRQYFEGHHITVVTDHNSLVWLQNIKKPSGRLARWLCRMQQFDFQVVHLPGAENRVPDALSRAVYNLPDPTDTDKGRMETEPDSVDLVIPGLPDFENIQDDWYNRLREQVLGHPEAYQKFFVSDNKLLKICDNPKYGRRVEKLVVPQELRETLIQQTHSSAIGAHFGGRKTLPRVSIKYYWPNMHSQIRQFVRKCHNCQQYKASNQANPAQAPRGRVTGCNTLFKKEF